MGHNSRINLYLASIYYQRSAFEYKYQYYFHLYENEIKLKIIKCVSSRFNVQRAVFQVYSGREQSSTIYKTTPVYRNERRYGSTTIDCQKFGYGLQYFVVCKYACKYKKGCTLTEINRFIRRIQRYYF
jgi:hypothetical protein